MKKTLIKVFYYFYAMLLLGFSVSVLMLIGYVILEKEINWNGAFIYFGVFIITILIIKHLIKRTEKNVG